MVRDWEEREEKGERERQRMRMKSKKFDKEYYLAFGPSVYQCRCVIIPFRIVVNSFHRNRMNNGTSTSPHKDNKTVVSLQDFY